MHATTRTVLSLAVAFLLAACGGGGGEAPSAATAASPPAIGTQGAPLERLRALATGTGSNAAAAVEISNAQFFEWAARILPSLFPANAVPLTLNLEGLTWDIRAYSTGNYLAVASNGRAYGLGPVTGNALVDLGPLQALSGQVCGVVACNTNPGGGGTGSLNDCAMPASQALATGNRWQGTYVSTSFVAGAPSGEYSIDARVDGPATFEAQSAVKMTTTLVGTEFGTTLNSINVTYARAGAGGLTDQLGHESQSSFGGLDTSIRVVFNPADTNTEFTLALGTSLTKSVTATTTTTLVGLPVPPQSNTATTNTTYKFEAREPVSVPAGTFNTCRYRATDGTGAYSLQWHIVGKGFAARFEQYSATGALAGRNDLKNATFNGAPL